MRVSVMQMNPGANKSENIAQARRLIERRSSRTVPISSACRKSGTPSAATAPRATANAEDAARERLQRTRRRGL